MAILPRKDVTPHTLSSVLTFGKYKGLRVAQVVKVNPEYLRWAVKNIDWFDLDQPTRAAAQKAIDLNVHNRAVRREAWAWGLLPKQQSACWGLTTDDVQN